MLEQLDLQFTRRGRRILAQRGGMDRVLQILASAPDWLSAGALCRELGLPPTEHNKRWLRLLAENSDGQIISGQLGYRLTTKASLQEIEESATWLEHQARRMADRARAIRRRAHRLI
ncbi:MAG: hypothetical protein N3J91_07035 [Verrucomicrobiae bacterium]|nr:hypothetical protein [Verrucomicrobiae bacterium]